MLKKLKEVRSKDKGFTIIEVMIVLAIAGLIMLIVFLAVPALQRNSRNTQRKNDVAALLAGVAEYASNNNGKMPSTIDQILENVKLSYYTDGTGNGPGKVMLWTAGPAGIPAATPDNDRVIIYTGVKCAAGGDTVQGTKRNVAAQYQIETANNPLPTCQEG